MIRRMRKLTTPVLMLVLAYTSGVAIGQEPIQTEDSQARSSSVQPSEKESKESPITLKQFSTDILHQQKPIFTFPWRAAHGKHWKPVVAITLGTIAMVVLDPYIEPFFHDRAQFDSYKTGPLRGRNTTLAVTMTLAVFCDGAWLRTRPTRAIWGCSLPKPSIRDRQLAISGGASETERHPPHGDLRNLVQVQR